METQLYDKLNQEEPPYHHPSDDCKLRSENERDHGTVLNGRRTASCNEKNEAAGGPFQDHVRDNWDNEIEFLFSCIALSVGLGNVWRFPFIALENGGGAFLIPYIIVLLLIGRPIYYMEIIIGQFSSRGCIKAFDMVPLMKGIAYGQVYSTALATTYYACVMALTIKYLIVSFSNVLPWSYCHTDWSEWGECTSAMNRTMNATTTTTTTSTNQNHQHKIQTSAELYFTKVILREKENINDGLGLPNWDLVFCLMIAWLIIGTILIRGIRSSGKAAYFIAIFPYVVMFVLLCRAATLPGSLDGILYFLKPQWDQLLNPNVWYAAITQMFFSLAICFGTLVMYASYNKFRKNVYRDVIIITSMDSLTSILAGCIIFGILGNLAYENHATDISQVVKGGAGLAFISYPEAISKFKYIPQLFAVLFFAMLLVLGIGSNIGMASCVMTVIKDRFVHLPHWLLAASISIIGFLFGLIYTTPGGQFILNLVDFYGCSFIALFMAIAELITVGWFYGVKRLCQDIEFMLNVKTGLYWRVCWAIVTPGLMIVVLVYSLINYQPLNYKGVSYPAMASNIAWLLWAFGVAQVPLWAIYIVYQQPGKTLSEKLRQSVQPSVNWGPLDSKIFADYILKEKSSTYTERKDAVNWLDRITNNIFG